MVSGYQLSRAWFNWSFANPEKISPNHTALYFFCIEHCNRLGWKEKFGLPTTMAKEAIGIKSYNTYIKTLNDLIAWEFIILIEKSTNQYSANIIALSNFNDPLNNALDNALIKHATKQSESTGESISSIDKPITNNNKQLTVREFLDREEAKAEDPIFYEFIDRYFKMLEGVLPNDKKVVTRDFELNKYADPARDIIKHYSFEEIKWVLDLVLENDFWHDKIFNLESINSNWQMIKLRGKRERSKK